MLRDRLLSRRWLVFPIVAWGVALAVAPRAADAAPLPPAGENGAAGEPAELRALLEARTVRQELLALGVSPADVETALARLTPAERAELAVRAHELRAGGSGVEFLAFAVIVALLVVLILELSGRRVISRP